MKLSEILRAGKANIETRGWCQGDEAVFASHETRCCAATAMAHDPIPHGEVIATIRMFERANNIHEGDIATWNDAPERTKEEVLAAYDKAIAAAEAQES